MYLHTAYPKVIGNSPSCIKREVFFDGGTEIELIGKILIGKPTDKDVARLGRLNGRNRLSHSNPDLVAVYTVNSVVYGNAVKSSNLDVFVCVGVLRRSIDLHGTCRIVTCIDCVVINEDVVRTNSVNRLIRSGYCQSAVFNI